MKFCDLVSGDRFKAYCVTWTKISGETARKHKYAGHGNQGATICSFQRNEKVDAFVECEHHRGTSDIVCPFCGEAADRSPVVEDES